MTFITHQNLTYMAKVEQHIAEMTTISGFIDRVSLLLSIYDTDEKAYESAERQYEQYFARRRYASYDSFRLCRSNFLKNKKVLRRKVAKP